MRRELREWLRNAPAMKPMFADPDNQIDDGKYRGMPNLNLTEDQIDSSSPTYSSGTKGALRDDDPRTPQFGDRSSRPSSRNSSALGIFRRPVATTGWKSWVFTVDHKKLGIMYGAVALFFFLRRRVRGTADPHCSSPRPTTTLLSAGLYNEMFTMHATTMVFLFVMPMAAGFANYFLPLQVGARDVAFPRMNALRASGASCSAASS